jgi:hypothetical protein
MPMFSENEIQCSRVYTNDSTTADHSDTNSRQELGLPNHEIATNKSANLVACTLPLYAVPSWEFGGVLATQHEIESLAERLKGESVISLDTETFGIGREPINARLSLIQIGIPGKAGGETFLIDVVKLTAEVESRAAERREIAGNPLAPLKEILENKAQLKIVQQAGFEREQFARYGISLSGVSDTLERSRSLLPGLPSHSLQALCAEYLGYSMSKEEQKSGWGKRPLDESQVVYAQLDPEITYGVWQVQQRLLDGAAPDQRLSVNRLVGELGKVFALRCAQEQKLLPELIEATAFIRGVKEELKSQLKSRAAELSDLSADEPLSNLLLNIESKWGNVKATRGSQSYPDCHKLEALLPEVAKEVISEKITKSELSRALREVGYKGKEVEDIIAKVLGETQRKHTFGVELHRSDLLKQHGLLTPVAPFYKSAHSLLSQEDLAEFSVELENAHGVSIRPVIRDGSFSGLVQIGIAHSQASNSKHSDIENRKSGSGVNVWVVSTLPDEVSADAFAVLRNKLATGIPALVEGKAAASKIVSRLVPNGAVVVDVGKQNAELYGMDLGATVPEWSPFFAGVSLDPRDDVGWHSLLWKVREEQQAVAGRIGEFLNGLDFDRPEEAVSLALSEIVCRQKEIQDAGRSTLYQRAMLHASETALLDALEAELREKLGADGGLSISDSRGHASVGLTLKEWQEIDPAKVRLFYPEVIETIESNRPNQSLGSFTQAELRQALNRLPDASMSAALREAVIEECFMTVEEGEPRVTISPKVQLMYQPIIH